MGFCFFDPITSIEFAGACAAGDALSLSLSSLPFFVQHYVHSIMYFIVNNHTQFIDVVVPPPPKTVIGNISLHHGFSSIINYRSNFRPKLNLKKHTKRTLEIHLLVWQLVQ